MIGEHGEVTIVDWGLAKHTGSKGSPAEIRGDQGPVDQRLAADFVEQRTKADELLGTPLYMSPEQAMDDGERVGPPCDLYSMGVVFYEFLSLEHYVGRSQDLGATLEAVKTKDGKLAYWVENEHQPRVPIELAYWLKKAMRKDPRKRFRSAIEMRSELQRAAGGQFDVVCPTTFSRRVFRCGMDSANKRPLVMILSMSVMTALSIYGAFRVLVDLF